MDILEEADNCTGINEFTQCMANVDDSELFSSIGCLPAWLIQDVLSYPITASIWKMDYCKAAVENVTKEFKQNLKDDFIDYLNFRLTKWPGCTEPCKHTFYTSTLATKNANRKAKNYHVINRN